MERLGQHIYDAVEEEAKRGAAGVKSVYVHLAGEIKSAMLLSGVAKTSDIKREHVVLTRT